MTYTPYFNDWGRMYPQRDALHISDTILNYFYSLYWNDVTFDYAK